MVGLSNPHYTLLHSTVKTKRTFGLHRIAGQAVQGPRTTSMGQMPSKQKEKKRKEKKTFFEFLPSWNKVQLSTVGWYCSSSSAILSGVLLRVRWYNFIKKKKGQMIHCSGSPLQLPTDWDLYHSWSWRPQSRDLQ